MHMVNICFHNINFKIRIFSNAAKSDCFKSSSYFPVRITVLINKSKMAFEIV